MPLINIVVALIVVGVALWLINNFVPMAREHQDHFEFSGRGCRLRLGPAGVRIVGAGNQL